MRRHWQIVIPLLLLMLFSFSNAIVNLWTDWLWFEETGHRVLFTQSFFTEIALTCVFAAIFFVVVYGNAMLARALARKTPRHYVETLFEFPQLEMLKSGMRWILLGGALVLSYLVGAWAGSQWDIYLRHQHAGAFGIADPLFARDIGFYFFTLPFYRFLYYFSIMLLVFSFIASLLVYLVEGGLWITPRGPELGKTARLHLFALAALFLLLWSVHYRLELFDLLFSERGIVSGASYSDVHAEMPALRLLMFLSVAAALLVLLSGFRQSYKLAWLGIGGLVVVSLIGRRVFPELMQRFQVAPNEISMETPYIGLEIKYTRMAYGIDQVQQQEFQALEDLSQEAIKKNELTLQNIRLWDHRPLLRTYSQLQVIRTYYDFVDVDNDRYLIDGKSRQVSLSPRELSSERLPSRIWINEHLTYTHGYGLCLGPVNQISKEGLPEFFVKDIPPAAATSLRVAQPQIYYGEKTDSYCFVKTGEKEFDYPSGDENVYTEYSGSGGIPVRSFWRKLLFSFKFKEPKIILSSAITPESRLMFARSIPGRVTKAVPFLAFDQDPYMVISDNGRLFWMMDGYTTGRYFPYSKPTARLGNYIRNSVKVTIDAYNGTMQFFISDPKDPVIQVYSKIYPGVFQPLEAMPADLRRHIRYPEDLFTIQANIYATYHMTDPQVFYNKEDLWRVPAVATPTEGDTPLEPYYTIMKLSGASDREEFILMSPFLPARRENMIAWMAARCDEPNYGKLVVYNFPKQRLVYGPSQIVSRVNQDARISQQLALWDRSGSKVIRGSLLVIPVQNSILYIQPLYLASSQEGGLPELKRIIVSYGNSIAMEETLELSLARIFGAAAAEVAPAVPTPQAGRQQDERTLKTLIDEASAHYERAQSALRQGNWQGYGEEIRRLEEVLKRLKEKAE
ncbi:MAG: UPF0182 family protein [Acidobacteria bacterium]|nr:UPF0182 family protein [Acidobacteriota bacterium]